MYTLTKINDHVVKPIPVYHPNPNKILGYSIIPMLYANIFICGRKGSGKTNITADIIETTIDKDTVVIVFCATHNSDANWIEIKKWLEDRKQPCMFFLNISENGVSHINDLMHIMQEQDQAEQEAIKNTKLNKKKKAPRFRS